MRHFFMRKLKMCKILGKNGMNMNVNVSKIKSKFKYIIIYYKNYKHTYIRSRIDTN